MKKTVKNTFRRIKAICGGVLVLGTLSFLSTQNTTAAPADLDMSFATGGKYVASSGPLSSGEVRAVLIQPDGKIILVGGASIQSNSDFALTRLNPNGTIDTTFGTNGITMTAFSQFVSSETAFAAVIQSDGKIVVAGIATNPSFVEQFAVARYSSNGAIDLSFGTNGKAMTDFTSRVSAAIGLVVQSDGKIVLAGSQDGKFALARLNANGSMDNSFGTNGKTVSQIVSDGNATANVLLMQPDGKLVVAGSRTGPTSDVNSSPVARYNTNGSLDNSFDGDGLAFPRLAFIKAGAIDGNGRLVFGGQGYFTSANDFGVARLNSDGSADTTFNGTGTNRLTVSNGPSNESWISSLAIQSDGGIVTAGRSYDNPNGYDFTVARFKANGTPELAFGNGGSVITHMGASQDWAYGLALQADGKFIVAGSSVYRWAAARYMGGAVPRPHKYDFDGDGLDNVAVVRSSQSSGLTWLINNSLTGFRTVSWGLATDKTANADYDGDGKTDIAVFRNGTWYVLRSLDQTLMAFQFGTAGDTPVPADYDGDGKADFTVVRNDTATNEATWYQSLTANGQFATQQFGISSDVLVPADYNGDGRAEVAVYRASEGRFYLSKGSRFDFDVIYWGTAGDKPVVADYDGDNKADAAVFRPSDGIWYIQGSAGVSQYIRWGLETDMPIPADYDGDNKADAAVYRDGMWFILQSSNSQMSAISFGQATDKPIQGL